MAKVANTLPKQRSNAWTRMNANPISHFRDPIPDIEYCTIENIESASCYRSDGLSLLFEPTEVPD
jgi:hypothetical protein